MFSGIVEEVGTIQAVREQAGGRRLSISSGVVSSDIKLGDSVAVAGVCLTVVAFGAGWFEVEAVAQTLRVTALGRLAAGSPVNLERALSLSDRLGGHLVSGHVDGLATVRSLKAEGASRLTTFETDQALSGLLVEKGSVAVDGVSLTVASLSPVSGGRFNFTVALIPHTLAVTTLGGLAAGDLVNVETDLVGKYVARLMACGYATKVNKGGLTLGLLAEHGYT